MLADITFTAETWTSMWTAINTLGLLGIAFIGYINNRRIKAVQATVDGPLTKAVNDNAKHTRTIAELTGLKVDDVIATAAEAVQANRQEVDAAVSSARKEPRARD